MHSSEDGHFLAVNIHSNIFVNVYQTHGGLPQGLRESLQELICSLPFRWQTILAGDWNQTPEEARYDRSFDLQLHCVLQADDHTPVPSRWKGSRCIDWILCSKDLYIDTRQYDDLAISDHKILCYDVVADYCKHDCKQLVPTRVLVPQCVDAEWKALLKQAWAAAAVPHATDTETEWEAFNKLAQDLHVETMTRTTGFHRQRNYRNKGSMPSVQVATGQVVRHSGTYRGRKLANCLGRCYELQRQHQRGQLNDGLRIKCQRTWPLEELWHHDIEVNIHRLEQALLHEHNRQRTQSLQAWKHKMTQGGKYATSWLKRNFTHTPVSIYVEDFDGTVKYTRDPQEAIGEVQKHWEQVWNRRLPDIDEAIRQWENWNTPVAHEHQDLESMLTGEKLFQEAQRLKGSSPGPCGWTGDELASWPVAAWNIYATLVHRWIGRNQFPQLWKHCRQVQVPKPGAEIHGGACKPKDLRPISVFSGLWRVLTSTIARDASTQQWANQYLPEACHGGLKQKDVFTAIASLDHAHTHLKLPLVSLDYSKCFDRVHPELAIRAMNSAGLPTSLADMLRHVWCDQYRWLQYGSSTSLSPARTGSSLPQGDGLCPMALTILLASPAKAMQHQFGATPFKQTIYLDDRNFVALPASIPRILHEWDMWSRYFGLQENHAKMKVVCRTKEQQESLLSRGIPLQAFADQARVLGVDFCRDAATAHRETAQQRLESAYAIASRITALKNADLRKMLWRTRVIPIATWGHLFRPLSKRDWKPLHRMYKKIFYVHKSGSVSLQHLLEGHMHNCVFMSGMKVLQAWMRVYTWSQYTDLAPFFEETRFMAFHFVQIFGIAWLERTPMPCLDP